VKFDDVGMVESRINFDLIFGDVNDLLCVFDALESIMFDILGFDEVHFSKAAFAQELDDSVFIDFWQLHV
jgi:hypothetical protein